MTERAFLEGFRLPETTNDDYVKHCLAYVPRGGFEKETPPLTFLEKHKFLDRIWESFYNHQTCKTQ